MGRVESVSASLGIKILLADLIAQINDTNFKYILDMLETGFIEDSNECYNEAYQNIIDNLPENSDKEYLIQQFTGCLIDQVLLVPVTDIVSTARWGYNRCETHGISRQIDFDLSVNVTIPNLEKYTRVFILKQSSS